MLCWPSWTLGAVISRALEAPWCRLQAVLSSAWQAMARMQSSGRSSTRAGGCPGPRSQACHRNRSMWRLLAILEASPSIAGHMRFTMTLRWTQYRAVPSVSGEHEVSAPDDGPARAVHAHLAVLMALLMRFWGPSGRCQLQRVRCAAVHEVSGALAHGSGCACDSGLHAVLAILDSWGCDLSCTRSALVSPPGCAELSLAGHGSHAEFSKVLDAVLDCKVSLAARART